MQKQGNTVFKVASILLLIWGLIAFILNVKDLIAAGSLLALVGGALLFGLILLVASTAVMAIAGLLGLLGANKPGKGKTFKIIAIIAVVMLLVGTIIILTSIVGAAGVNWIFTIIGLGLCCFYIVTANQLG